MKSLLFIVGFICKLKLNAYTSTSPLIGQFVHLLRVVVTFWSAQDRDTCLSNLDGCAMCAYFQNI